MSANDHGIVAVTGRAHCQHQVAFFYCLLYSAANLYRPPQSTQNVFELRRTFWDFAGHEKSDRENFCRTFLKAILKCPARCNFCAGHFAQFPLAGQNEPWDPLQTFWDFVGHEKSDRENLCRTFLKANLKCPARCNFCAGHFAQFSLAGQNVQLKFTPSPDI